MSSEDRPSDSGQNHRSRRHEPDENNVRNRRVTQHAAFQHTYPSASYIYYPSHGPMTYPVAFVYAPTYLFPSTYGDLGGLPAANRMSLLANQSSITSFNGGAVAWNEPVPMSYMHVLPGSNAVFLGPPQVPVYAVIPYIGRQHHNLNGTQHPSHRGSNRGHNNGCRPPQLPAPSSSSAPRFSSLQVSRGASSYSRVQRIEPRNDASQVSMNAPSNSGAVIVEKAPQDMGTPTSAAEQPREAEPVNETNPRYDQDFHMRVSFVDEVMIIDLSDHVETEGRVDAETRYHVTFDGRIIDDLIEQMRSSPGLADETITGQLEAIEEPSTSETNHDENSCVICLDVYKDQQAVRTLNCGHKFHSDCIRKWLRLKKICPICRADAWP